MLEPELGRDPYGDVRIASGRIREQLTEMAAVGPFQLVLDGNVDTLVDLARQDIEIERADRLFLADELYLDAQFLAKKVEILGQPGREV